MRISDWSSDVCSSDLRNWTPGPRSTDPTMPSKPRIPFKISEPSSSCFASSSTSLGSVLLPLHVVLVAPSPRPAVFDPYPVEAPVAPYRPMQDHPHDVKRGPDNEYRASEPVPLPPEEK